RRPGLRLGQPAHPTTALHRHYEGMDPEHPIPSSESSTHVDPPAATGAVRLDVVHFRSEDAPAHVPDVIDGASLEIRPGETMALVGVTGSRKSTLLQRASLMYAVSTVPTPIA